MIPAIQELKGPEEKCTHDYVNSTFVELTTNDYLQIEMQYPLRKMAHSINVCYVRKEVCDLLNQASSMLPSGYRIKVLDAWRPLMLQQELYELYSRKIIKDMNLSSYTEAERNTVIKKYVSFPSKDFLFPPVHTTGGAIDVTIVDSNNNELFMGTSFDEFSDLTHTAAFEMSKDLLIRDNRRLLYHIMTAAGFVNYPSEWWHYDYGNWSWAYYTNKAALYSGVFTLEELHEI